MARGWESKSIESQQADAARPATKGREPTREARAAEALRRELLLTRARVVADLSAATNPVHRQMLEQALASLDERLSAL
jgi:hypothetical protein